MNTSFTYFSIMLFIILTSTRASTGERVWCPRYCACYLDPTNNMRSVSCIARRLDNIDLAIPKKVQSVDLSNNSISILEDRGFQNLGLIEIVKLILRHNSIRTIGLHSFVGLPYLQWLDLSDNNLYQILPWTFHDNSNLKFLSLSGNPLGHVVSSGPILDIPQLEILELSSCNFAYFSPDAFSALPSLKKLDISHNQLINVDIYEVQFLYYLQELDVSRENWYKASNLRKNNTFFMLANKNFYFAAAIGLLYLNVSEVTLYNPCMDCTRNPWPCNANLKHLKEYLNSKSSKLVGSMCELPEQLHKVQIEPAKFAKIISVDLNSPEYTDDSNSDEEKNSVEETSSKNQSDCNCRSESKTVILEDNSLILPPMLLVLISFQLGMCTTLFLGYIWIYCSKKKSKYRALPVVTQVQPSLIIPAEVETQSVQTSQESMICPETPPPSYREIFMT